MQWRRFFQIFHGEFILQQEVVVVQTPAWKFKAISIIIASFSSILGLATEYLYSQLAIPDDCPVSTSSSSCILHHSLFVAAFFITS